jgi:hypothetical protein
VGRRDRLWVPGTDDPDPGPRAATALRTANLVLIRGTPVAWWDRLGIHEERGPTSFHLATETIAGHDRAYLLQLDQTITALQR